MENFVSSKVYECKSIEVSINTYELQHHLQKMLCYLLLTLCIVFFPQLQVFAKDNVTLYVVKDDNIAVVLLSAVGQIRL